MREETRTYTDPMNYSNLLEQGIAFAQQIFVKGNSLQYASAVMALKMLLVPAKREKVDATYRRLRELRSRILGGKFIEESTEVSELNDELWIQHFRTQNQAQALLSDLSSDLYDAIMEVLDKEGYLEKHQRKQIGGADRDFHSEIPPPTV